MQKCEGKGSSCSQPNGRRENIYTINWLLSLSLSLFYLSPRLQSTIYLPTVFPFQLTTPWRDVAYLSFLFILCHTDQLLLTASLCSLAMRLCPSFQQDMKSISFFNLDWPCDWAWLTQSSGQGSVYQFGVKSYAILQLSVWILRRRKLNLFTGATEEEYHNTVTSRTNC